MIASRQCGLGPIAPRLQQGQLTSSASGMAQSVMLRRNWVATGPKVAPLLPPMRPQPDVPPDRRATQGEAAAGTKQPRPRRAHPGPQQRDEQGGGGERGGDESSCRIRIEGVPAVISRMMPPTQAVITPAATAGTGGTP